MPPRLQRLVRHQDSERHGGRQSATRRPASALIIAGTGIGGEWQYANLSILFEIPKYDILDDDQNFGLPEYLRYTEWLPVENLETIARKGQTLTFLANPARGKSRRPRNGDRLLRQPAGALKVITYDVAIDWVMLGRLIPSNILKRISTVNSALFPRYAYPDQTSANGGLAQYRPGTLLGAPSKFTSRAQAAPGRDERPDQCGAVSAHVGHGAKLPVVRSAQ